MRKFISPHDKRKVLDVPNKTFGVPLDELVRQASSGDGECVPAPVKKICEHIFRHGEFDLNVVFNIDVIVINSIIHATVFLSGVHKMYKRFISDGHIMQVLIKKESSG
jgi:hypothetical protein